MSKAVARRAVDWLFQASGDAGQIEITFFGGEPLLNRPVFDDVMEYSANRAVREGKTIRYVMTTNGTLIDAGVIDYIKAYNFGLMVSLDGPPDIQNRQRPFADGRGSFEEAARGISALMRRRKRVTVRCTLTNTVSGLLDLIRFFESFGFTRIAFGLALNSIRESAADCDRETVEEYERQQEGNVLSWILDELARDRIPSYFPYARFIREQASVNQRDTGPRLFHCGACRGTSTVAANGTIYPCHRFVGVQAFSMGHINDGPCLEKAGEFWLRYHAATEDTCSRCWARKLCNGPCPWLLVRADGSFRSPTEWQCIATRRALERAAWVLWTVQTEFPAIYRRLTANGYANERMAVKNT